MSTPKYCVRITGNELNGREISCTGEQLCLVLEEISHSGRSLAWFSADVTLNSTSAAWDVYDTGNPVLIGNYDALLALCKDADQFTSGVFLGVLESDTPKQWTKAFDTEDVPFSENDTAYIEIRAFDTTYFEIYSCNHELLKGLSERFGSKIGRAHV